MTYTCTATERVKIGKYSGNTKACRYFFRVWKRKISESTARNKYLKELNERKEDSRL